MGARVSAPMATDDELSPRESGALFGETYVTAPANDFWKRSKDCANDFWKRSKDFWKKPAKPTVAKPKTQEDRDYLTMMYEEHAEHARQHEVLRAAATGFFLALIAGLLAATIGGSNTGNKDRIIGSIICGLSILGVILNAKHYERYRFHLDILRGFRKSLESGVTNTLTTINRDFRSYHESQHWIFSKIDLNVLYLCIYVITFVIGAAVLYLSRLK
jgi:hypothetical protein